MLEYVRIARIDHWLKNIFIVFGHAAAIVLVAGATLDGPMVLKCFLSLIPACFIASANYILNEILDAPFDRLHPTKKDRGVAAGLVSVPILWGIKAALIVAGFGMAFALFSKGYIIALAMLLVSGFVYNIPPVRVKDRAFLDVIAESFNNPIRLWLGWFAAVPDSFSHWPPLSIVLAWWCFGGLLMTGKRYSEFRFIGDDDLSGRYRKSFKTYTERKLIIAMITYANLFCFCTGIAMAVYEPLNNLVLVFPLIVVAIVAYFQHAMSEVGARLEPEQLLQNKFVVFFTVLTGAVALWLLHAQEQGTFQAKEALKLMQPLWTK